MARIYDVATFDIQSGVGKLVNQLRSAIFAAIDKELAPLDLTAAQYVVIATLANCTDVSAGELCKRVSYDPGAMTRMIDRLEQSGFVRRVPCPRDRRSIRLELTPNGREVYPKLLARVVEVLNHFLRGFSKAEAAQLTDFLKRMLANA